MKDNKAGYVVQAAMIAAIYVVLVIIFNYWSYGVIQFRIAEALTILPYFTPAAIPGLFVGCFIANLMGGAVVADLIFGSLATLIGAAGSYLIGKYVPKKAGKWMVGIPPIIANMLIIPFVLKWGYGMPEGIPYMMFTIGVSEFIVCGIIGEVLLAVLEKYRGILFRR